MNIGIIGGSGFYKFEMEGAQLGQVPLVQRTDYGEVNLFAAEVGENLVYFIPRHGVAHSIAPHTINYRANIMALHELGCTDIIATNAVGSLKLMLHPGDFVIPHDYIDMTRNRYMTFFDGTGGKIVHVDQTQAYNPYLREVLISAGAGMDVQVHPSGVYICSEGPRFETPAEIRVFSQWGADVVGMTGIPEVVLAGELEMRYASLCVVTNYAAGVTDRAVMDSDLQAVMADSMGSVRAMVMAVINRIPA